MRSYSVMLLVGMILAFAVEMLAVHVLNRWVYVDAMPLLPGTGIGLVPIVQMIVLPAIIFLVASAILRRWFPPDRKPQ